jgi:hypothetical protein
LKYGDQYIINASSNKSQLVNINVVDKLKMNIPPEQIILIRLKEICREFGIDYNFPHEIQPMPHTISAFQSPSEYHQNVYSGGGFSNNFPNNGINEYPYNSMNFQQYQPFNSITNLENANIINPPYNQNQFQNNYQNFSNPGFDIRNDNNTNNIPQGNIHDSQFTGNQVLSSKNQPGIINDNNQLNKNVDDFPNVNKKGTQNVNDFPKPPN